MPTLRKIKRAASQHTSQRFAAHLILPNRTQSPPPDRQTVNKIVDKNYQ